jgi:farnesol dehydrogenase
VKIFLTGATGYLGSRLAEALVRAGHSLTCLSRSPEKGRALEALKAEVVVGDVTEFDELQLDLSQFEAVFHCAALVRTRVKDPRDFDRVNVEGVANVARRSLEAGVRRFLYTSSFIALGPAGDDAVPLDESARHDPGHLHNDYERTKFLGLAEYERWVERGLPGTAIFPCVIYGPGALTSGNITAGAMADLILGRLPGILGDGTRQWTYSYIADVVAGHLGALERGAPGERYILGGESASMEDFVKMTARIAGVKAPKRHIPWWLTKIAALVEESRASLAGCEPKLTRGIVEVYKHHWIYSCQKAKADIAYEVTPLERGLTETVAWLKRAIAEGEIK